MGNLVPTKRVLVIETDALLSAGLLSLLSSHPDFEVHTVKFECVGVLVQDVYSLNPDVIVIDSGFLANNVLDFLPIWLEFPQVRVLSMSMEDNRLQVYDKKQVLVKRSQDFFSAI